MDTKEKLVELRKQYKNYIFSDIDSFLVWQYYTKLNICSPMLNYLERGYPIHKTDNILCIANKNKIKNFVKNNGYIIFMEDKQFDKKEEYIIKVKRRKHGSKGQKRARRALRQRLDEVAKEVTDNYDLIVIEGLKNITKNTKKKNKKHN